MKKDFIDIFANYIFTGSALFIAFVLIGLIVDNLRVVINITLIMFVILFSGAVVYEGINYIYKKWLSTKNKG